MERKTVGTRIKENALVAAVIGVLWLALGWLRSFGLHSALLWPLNYLTGALAGVDGGSVIGGAVGKALLMMALSSFLRPLLLKKGPLKVRLKAAGNAFGLRLVKQIPGYTFTKLLTVRGAALWGCTLLGIGWAFVTYPFLTGNGSFQNSFVCLLLGFSLWKILLRQKGLILAVLNKLLGFRGRHVNEKIFQVIAGSSAGYTLTGIFSAFWPVPLAFALGVGFLLGGIVLLLFGRAKKEVAAV